MLSRYAISPEHLTAPRRIALIACASNPSLYICNYLPSVFFFSCFCWHLLAFFKINFFLSNLIGVQTDCIGYEGLDVV